MLYREADEFNTHLFHEGTARSAYEYMGAHAATHDGTDGYMFRVWAPRAQSVSVVGDFNSWDASAHPMKKITQGIWERFIPGGNVYDAYKFAVTGANGATHLKADPYASTPRPAPAPPASSTAWRTSSGTTAPGRSPGASSPFTTPP